MSVDRSTTATEGSGARSAFQVIEGWPALSPADSFIGQAWRGTPLVRQMMIRACAVLEAYARARNYPCIGVLLELENARFNTSLRSPFWRSTRFHYIGKSERGLEMRAFYFEGARLKTPAEIEALRFPIH